MNPFAVVFGTADGSSEFCGSARKDFRLAARGIAKPLGGRRRIGTQIVTDGSTITPDLETSSPSSRGRGRSWA